MIALPVTVSSGGPVAREIAPGGPLFGVVLAAGVLVFLLLVHKITRRRLAAYVQQRRHKQQNADAFLRGYDAVCKVLIAVLTLVALAGSLPMLGLSMALIGTMLGWSLQTPVRGLAAWVMVVLKRPFRVGDRIRIADVTGDVTDIQLNHIVLNQVGGTVSGEEPCGRGILVPTAMLFGEEIINYDLLSRQEYAGAKGTTSRFLLDEVLVRVTFGSDYELAKALCVQAARQAVGEIIGEVDEEPFTRTGFVPQGVLIRVRYKTRPAKRQELSSRVTELIWKAFTEHAERVRFRIPTAGMAVVSRREDAAGPFPPAGEDP
ncbi:MAG TPA: mechanosensitive ion channel family protein [Phycisphaerae bacterium]|nr:mechanosensitive ion channel family protein [Phycisphaerae bacterium]